MLKFVGGIFMLLLALALTGWLGYNLLIERQKEFQMNPAAFGFMAGLYFVGGKWVLENSDAITGIFRPKKRKKKSTKRSKSRDE